MTSWSHRSWNWKVRMRFWRKAWAKKKLYCINRQRRCKRLGTSNLTMWRTNNSWNNLKWRSSSHDWLSRICLSRRLHRLSATKAQRIICRHQRIALLILYFSRLRGIQMTQSSVEDVARVAAHHSIEEHCLKYAMTKLLVDRHLKWSKRSWLIQKPDHP
jgi:hypothetical protein